LTSSYQETRLRCVSVRFIKYKSGERTGLAVQDDQVAHGYFEDDAAYPGGLETLLAEGADGLKRAADVLRRGGEIDLTSIGYLPPLPDGKLVCVGLNYRAHVKEAAADVPKEPTIFARFKSSLIGCGCPLILPRVSTQFDWEGELVAVVGKRGRYIPKDKALDYVAGYSVFNDATIRDYQFETTQWTVRTLTEPARLVPRS
jgi:acylpyruvate hydrolase